jgi:hypothetical protein
MQVPKVEDASWVVQAVALSRDGTEVLVHAGDFDDEPHHAIYAIPLAAGGTPRLLASKATSPSWTR